MIFQWKHLSKSVSFNNTWSRCTVHFLQLSRKVSGLWRKSFHRKLVILSTCIGGWEIRKSLLFSATTSSSTAPWQVDQFLMFIGLLGTARQEAQICHFPWASWGPCQRRLLEQMTPSECDKGALNLLLSYPKSCSSLLFLFAYEPRNWRPYWGWRLYSHCCFQLDATARVSVGFRGCLLSMKESHSESSPVPRCSKPAGILPHRDWQWEQSLPFL